MLNQFFLTIMTVSIMLFSSVNAQANGDDVGDAGKGEKVAKKCAACHTFDKDGKDKVGPNLFGIVGKEVGKKEGFGYSDVMAAKGGTWTEEELDAFLKKPKDYLKGTKMTFAGIKKESQRADLIAYLKTLTE